MFSEIFFFFFFFVRRNDKYFYLKDLCCYPLSYSVSCLRFSVLFVSTLLLSSMTIYEVHTISFQTFFVWALLLIVHALKTLVPFEVISSGCNAIVVPFQQLLEGPMEVLLGERVNDLRHSLFHLLNCLIMTASELRE